MPVIDMLNADEMQKLLNENKSLRLKIKQMQKAIRGALKVEAERHKIEIQFFDEPSKARSALERLKRAECKAWINLGKVAMTA